jgi:hypothetical protein
VILQFAAGMACGGSGDMGCLSQGPNMTLGALWLTLQLHFPWVSVARHGVDGPCLQPARALLKNYSYVRQLGECCKGN